VDELKLRPGVYATADHGLWLEKHKAIVVSDLHVGYESAALERGVGLPRFQQKVMMERLRRLLERYGPERVIVAGDLKHDFSRNLAEEWRSVREIVSLLKGQSEPVLVRGNHDNYLKTIISRFSLDLPMKHQEGRFTIAHGHEEVAVKGTLVMGHEHPAVKLRDEVGAVVSAPAFLAAEDLIILPAFSPLAAGVDVNEYPKLSPMLAERRLDGARVVAMDGKEGLLDFGPAAGLLENSPASDG
jgi:putative SbcD/Mre11-related phosphoesterase